MQLNTFSIAAYDPNEEAFGIGVASKFLAAGAVVSWARAGVGAVATQAYAKVGFGADGLALMESGKSAQETLDILLAADPKREDRQVGMVDLQGRAAAHTGANCFDWAGHKVGEGFTCQGNILTGLEVVEAMASAYTSASGELADRLVSALIAGNDAGGDKRGKQSAAVLVVRVNGGYGGDNDRYLDLRVDDDANPVYRLRELVDIHHLLFGKPHPDDQLPITEDISRELQAILGRAGYMTGETRATWDDDCKKAFWGLVGSENLEERWNIEQQPDMIDRVALGYLRRRFPSK